jgi:hypothetical protein
LEAADETGPLDVDAANRVRPVADDHGNAVPRRRAQTVRHRVDERIDPGPDILQVDHQDVDVSKHLGCRLPRLAVERVHGHPPGRILAMGRLDHVVLDVRSEAVLRSEDGAQRDAVGPGKPVDHVTERAVNRRVVADDADARITKTAGCDQYVGSEADGVRRAGHGIHY